MRPCLYDSPIFHEKNDIRVFRKVTEATVLSKWLEYAVTENPGGRTDCVMKNIVL